MKTPLAMLAAILIASPAIAQETETSPELPVLTMEQETSLRCGVAFAVVHAEKDAGKPEFADYPELGERGREFFVRSTAQLVESTGADREVVGMLVVREARGFIEKPQAVHDVMPACLMVLDASGL
jgi:hypothetical protein